MTSEFRTALDELDQSEGRVGRALVERFSNPDPADVELFRRRFFDLRPERRHALLSSMVENAEENFELLFHDLYRVALEDPLPAVRRQAIEGLWEDERLDLVRTLTRMLETDPSDSVRAAAASALGRFVFRAECDELDRARGQRIRAVLEQAIDMSASIEVARRALESLAFINDDDVTRRIDRAYIHADPLMRQSAVFAMGRSADRLWTETVLAELHSEDPAMRYEAARASGELRLSRALPLLVRLVTADRDAEVRLMSVWALGEIGGKRAQRLLEELVEGEDEVLATAAGEALERLEFVDGSIDLLIFDVPEEQDAEHVHPLPEVDAVPGDASGTLDPEEGPDEDYIRDFDLYVSEYEDEPEDEGDEEEWPDDFLERE